MTSHLPIQLRDGTAAFVSRLYTIAGHDEVAWDSTYSPSFELSRQKNPQPADSVRRLEKKRPSEGSRRMALSGPKTFARPEYVPLWNSELNVWRSGFAGFLSPLAKSVASPMRGRQRADEKEYRA